MIVKFKKGRHLSNQLTTPRFNLFSRNQGALQAEVIFNDSCKYVLSDPKEQEDWNKLLGCSWGFSPLLKAYMMHQNSSRFGVRFNPKTDLFETTWYLYDNGKRSFGSGEDVVSFQSKEKVLFYINPFPSFQTAPSSVFYQISVNGKNLFAGFKNQLIPNIDGWNAPGYFGGTLPAPHDMNYELNYI